MAVNKNQEKKIDKKEEKKQDPREQMKQHVIAALNTARSMELYAIHQYMNQHYNLDDEDFGEFAANIKLIAIDEMRHAEEFAERIKELDGEPTTEMNNKVIRGQDVTNVFNFNDELEDDTIHHYNEFLQVCRDNNDNLSAKLFETIIDEEQAHLNYFQDVSSHIKRLGNTYLSKIAGTPGDTDESKGFVSVKNNPEDGK